MNCIPVETGEENLSQSGIGKSHERIGNENWKENAGDSALPVWPYRTKGDVAVASRSASIEANQGCPRADDEVASQ